MTGIITVTADDVEKQRLRRSHARQQGLARHRQSAHSPRPNGTCALVHDGKLITHHYLLEKQILASLA